MVEQKKLALQAKFSQMPTPQLQHMLLLSLHEDTDTETVEVILEVLEKRNGSDEEAALRALNKLEQFYNTPDGDRQELYSSRVPKSTSRRNQGRRFRWLTRVAACCVIMLSVMIAVQATGVDIFGMLAEWTDSIFHYSVSENGNVPSTAAQTAALAESEIQLALADVGMPANFAPTWVPEGYTLVKLKQVDTLISTGVCATFSDKNNDDALINVNIRTCDDIGAVEAYLHEKEAKNVETVTGNGRTFYLFSNTAGWTGAWSDGQYMVTVTGVNSRENIVYIIEHFGG